jgi:hypothetical protein
MVAHLRIEGFVTRTNARDSVLCHGASDKAVNVWRVHKKI